MTDIGKLLNLQPQSDQSQLINVNKIPSYQYIAPQPGNQAPMMYPQNIKINFQPNSDFSYYLRVYTPFKAQTTPDEMKSLLVRTIQQLRPIKYPTLHELDYYSAILLEEGCPIKYQYSQVIEIIELVSQFDRNFTVVASRLRRSSLNAIQCMEAFGMYAKMCYKESPSLTPEQKRANDVLFYFKTKIMENKMQSKLIQDEYDYQCNQRETEACFSPIRLIQERFDVVNEVVSVQPKLGNLIRTDFQNQVQEVQKKQVKNIYPMQQVPRRPTTPTAQPPRQRAQPTAYQMQLLKTMQPPPVQVKPQSGTQADIQLETLVKQAQQKCTYQTIFANQTSQEKMSQLMQFYNINLESSSINNQGSSPYFVQQKISVLIPGKLGLMVDQQGFPGHYEFDYSGDITNACSSACFKWQIDDSAFNNCNVHDESLKVIFQDMKKSEQKELKNKVDYVQNLRKEINGFSIDLKQFFQLERMVGSRKAE